MCWRRLRVVTSVTRTRRRGSALCRTRVSGWPGGVLLRAPRDTTAPFKENATPLAALYVDGDGAKVGSRIPEPTATVESSPGREQFWWALSEPVAPKEGEELNRRLAYAMGADRSGWDLTQLMRVPGTRNRKYADAPDGGAGSAF